MGGLAALSIVAGGVAFVVWRRRRLSPAPSDKVRHCCCCIWRFVCGVQVMPCACRTVGARSQSLGRGHSASRLRSGLLALAMHPPCAGDLYLHGMLHLHTRCMGCCRGVAQCWHLVLGILLHRSCTRGRMHGEVEGPIACGPRQALSQCLADLTLDTHLSGSNLA